MGRRGAGRGDRELSLNQPQRIPARAELGCRLALTVLRRLTRAMDAPRVRCAEGR